MCPVAGCPDHRADAYAPVLAAIVALSHPPQGKTRPALTRQFQSLLTAEGGRVKPDHDGRRGARWQPGACEVGLEGASAALCCGHKGGHDMEGAMMGPLLPPSRIPLHAPAWREISLLRFQNPQPP